MRSRLTAVAVFAMCGALAITGIASAGNGRAETKVTIKAEGTDLFGFVKSPDPDACADGRLVKVFRVKRGDKERIGSDTSELNGDRYQWSLGNTGLYGKFYAKVRRTADCDGDKSKTIRVQRPTNGIY